jgi:hypothetical protein
MLSVMDKVNVITQIQREEKKKADMCWNSANSTIQTIWKCFWGGGGGGTIIEKKMVLKWYKQKRSENVWDSSSLLMNKTKELAKLLNDRL